ncbi:MAG: hypothetical protein Q8P18_10000 [Pseudomonadota bacterium]|nr:hypothetical protein [Pseudomonadota bacterium]
MVRTAPPASSIALLSTALLSTVLLGTGCDSDCVDTSRVNGTYAMWHTTLNTAEGGDATVSESYPSYDVFVNGWSKWKINWSAGSDTINADITDVAESQSGPDAVVGTTQSFAGSLTSSADDCNTFAMHVEGSFETRADTTHAFMYDANVVYVGDHLNGTFTYSDTFTGTAEDGSAVSGMLENATGELSGTLQIDGFDTGFSE